MLISKKDLLIKTGISYGQLYRWKRERLIPEEWFIKQPSYTGQETFFPKDKIMKRINSILELKDKYSLEELSKILSPIVSERNFTIEDLSIIEEINQILIPSFVKGFQKNNFRYIEIIIMISISELKNECFNINNDQITDIIIGIKSYLEKIKSTGYIFIIFNKDLDYYATIYQEDIEIFMDERLNIVKKIKLNDISNNIKLKYRKSFNFQFDFENDKNNDDEIVNDKNIEDSIVQKINEIKFSY